MDCLDSENDIPMSHKRQQSTQPNGSPWFLLLSSIPVWSIIVNNFVFHYSVYVIMNWLPTYFASILKADLAILGGVKTLPYLIMFLASNMGGWMGDWFILRQRTSVSTGRKLVNTIGERTLHQFALLLATLQVSMVFLELDLL